MTILISLTSTVAISVGLVPATHGYAVANFQDMPVAGGEREGRSPTSPVPPVPPDRPNINPYDRDVEITAPLQFNKRILGEIPVLLTSDDRFIVSSVEFFSLISPLLTPEASEELAVLLDGKLRFRTEEIAASGILLDYDPEQLALLVLKIAPERRSVEALYRDSFPEEPGDAPEPFSAFLNLSTAVTRLSQEGRVNKPDLFFNGAGRYHNLVFETDAQIRGDFVTDEYKFERRYARLVMDQPDHFRRWFAGDMDPETRGRQGFVNIGGVGVVRQKRRYDAFRRNVFSGGRQLVLREQSVVRVSRNGIFQREFTLDPGQYDISNLPLDTGSNNIVIDVEGLSGTRQSYDYQAYLDTIDLEPGDHEYGAYFGVLDEGGFSNPDYSNGTPVFTGFWRKAFLNRPAIGVGTQLSEGIQNFTGQTQFLLGRSGKVQIDLGASNAPTGVGYAATVGYDHIIGAAIGYDTVTVVVDYASKNYSTVGILPGVNPISWNLAAAYTKRFSADLFTTANVSFRKSRSPLLSDGYSLSTTANYRFSREWSVQVGAQYLHNGFAGTTNRRDGFGLTLGLIWQPRYDRRGEARYDTLRNFGSARFQQSAGNRAGSFGYSVATTYNDGENSLGGELDYVGNRFDASLTHTAFGNGFGDLGKNQITSLRAGTSIAYAGGLVALGRTINDSFALVYPHETLGGRSVIVGDTLEGGEFVSKSGALGPAVQNNLNAFFNQSVRYDVADPPLGYDIGDGVKRVRPTYKSGYAIEVGSAAFVSAMGTLTTPDGRAVKLASGILRRADDPEGAPEPFFTNSAGRFAIANLTPGVAYVVQLYFEGSSEFYFRVPEDSEGLLSLNTVQIERVEGR